MSIFDQMGNIYSEVGRTFKAKRSHDDERYEQALVRAIDLFEATSLALAEQRSPNLSAPTATLSPLLKPNNPFR